MEASSSSSSSSSCQWGYDVFLSFRGEDTRNNFTGHLYDALRRKGINAFIDADKLRRGQVISPSLLTAIESSAFSIIVLSENYASSRWCLAELAKILDCMKTRGQCVLPIFYNVDPSDVRNRRGNFGDALNEHGQTHDAEEVQVWRDALTEVANLSGWDSRNKHEPSLIKEIVGDVFNRLLVMSSSDGGDLVGMHSHFRIMKSLLSVGSNDVRIIGIWGMGGIGKTTIAKFVYDQILEQFEAHCFLGNVREESEKHGLVQLQKELLSQLLEEEKIRISTVDSGRAFIRKRLHFMRVLIVLDDAHNIQQLACLAGKHDWFGPGSRIIITTRDKDLLNKIGVDGVYKVAELNHNDAVKLFSQHAFKEDHPTEGYMELLEYAVSYAQGLPLALRVLGSSLFGRSELEWKSQLNKLKMNPLVDIESVLQVSFDALDDTEKDIFLDVACFFKGMDKDYVIKILDSCGFHPHIGIRVLIDKALISLVHNTLWMHDLLQEMGWDVVRKTSHKNLRKRHKLDPGKCSRLWLQEDVYDVLTEKTGTENIEGIFMDLNGLTDMHFTTEAFAKMKKLRLLKVYNSKHSGGSQSAWREENYKKPVHQDFEFPSNKLSYLYWTGCPLKSLPSDFHPRNLFELNLCYCHVEELWKGIKHMEKLECIDLSHSQHLIRTPDFSGIPNLESLILKGCSNLCEVHQSLGFLKKLIFLDLKDCKNLKHFPSSIELESLKVLNLSGCSKLSKFPVILGCMPNLLELNLSGTAIAELPPSIRYATQLVSLDMKNCKKFTMLPCSICKLKSLKFLRLSGCAKFWSFPDILEDMEGLRELFLDGTAVKELPSSVERLTGLVLLNLRNSRRLITLPCGICKLKSLNTLVLSGCSQLKKLPENLGKLECLVELMADGTAVVQPPSSIVSLSGFYSLKNLNLSDCKIKDVLLPDDFGGHLSSLEYLNLSGNDFATLPISIGKLSNLKSLYLSRCKRLQNLPMLPSTIKRIEAQNCKSLVSDNLAPFWLAFTNSFKQNWKEEHTSLFAPGGKVLFAYSFSSKPNWRPHTYSSDVSLISKFNIYLPASGIPEWFSNQCMGNSINIQLPDHWYNPNFLGFAMCVVFVLKEPSQCSRVAILCNLESNDLDPSNLGCFTDHIVWEGSSGGDHIWLGYHPNFLIKFEDMDWPNKLTHIKASFVVVNLSNEIKWCGFRLVYKGDMTDNHSKLTKCSPLSKKSTVVLQELDESSTKDTLLHDASARGGGEPSENQSSDKDLLACHEPKLEESKTLTRKPDHPLSKLLECFCITWIDLFRSNNGHAST